MTICDCKRKASKDIHNVRWWLGKRYRSFETWRLLRGDGSPLWFQPFCYSNLRGVFRDDVPVTGNFLQFLEEHPEVASKINSMLVKRLRIANESVGDVVFLDVPTRVAKQLLALAETYYADLPEGAHIVVPLGQEELAGLVGASRETVSRDLSSYRNMGVLSTANRRISIIDLPRLGGMADF